MSHPIGGYSLHNSRNMRSKSLANTEKASLELGRGICSSLLVLNQKKRLKSTLATVSLGPKSEAFTDDDEYLPFRTSPNYAS